MDEVKIRPPRLEDAEDLHAIFSDPKAGRTLGRMPLQALETTRKRLENPRDGYYMLVTEVGGRAVGLVSLQHYNSNPRRAHSGGLGMAVHPDFWNRGIGSKLMEAILDLTDNWLNLKRVELEVNTDNPAGIHLYEKFGFEHEGLMREHIYGDGRFADCHFISHICD